MAVKKQFTKQLLLCILEEEDFISNELVDTSRWSLHYTMIFPYGNKFYEAHYTRGATEQQDESPWEYSGELIECYEVKPVTKTITVYERVKE